MGGKLGAISGALVGIVAFAGVALVLSPSEPPSTFPGEAQAQQHCPSETVVIALKKPDGTVTAARLYAEKDGIKPPM